MSKLIEKLFEDAHTELEKNPPSIIPPDLSEIQIPKEPPKEAPARRFNRADVSDKAIQLKFNNDTQFARHYINNISLGGLFVKTDSKPAIGEIIPIEFSIPNSKKDMQAFALMAKVCRVTADGVGLEFTNLTTEMRAELEAYVQSVLPSGSSVHVTAAQSSTVQRLKESRERKAEELAQNKSRLRKIALLVLAILANSYLLTENIRLTRVEGNPHLQTINIQGRQIPLSVVRSVSKNKDGKISIRTGAEELEIPSGLELPKTVQSTVNLLRSTPVLKKNHRSRTAPRLVQKR